MKVWITKYALTDGIIEGMQACVFLIELLLI